MHAYITVQVKSWKRRLFVLDGGELAYFKDGLMADRGGEVSLCGATLSYLDKSATSGCAAIEIHSGKRDLLMECDSSALAEVRASSLLSRCRFKSVYPTTAAAAAALRSGRVRFTTSSSPRTWPTSGATSPRPQRPPPPSTASGTRGGFRGSRGCSWGPTGWCTCAR